MFKKIFNQKKNQQSIDYIYLELTNACNMNCPMCITKEYKSNKKELSVQQIKNKILIPGKDFGASVIIITGGEPTLSDKFIEVINIANELNYGVFLATNLLNFELNTFNNLLTTLNTENNTILVSFDSIKEKEMNKIRGGCFYKRVLENSKKLVELKKKLNSKILISGSITLQEDNAFSFLETVDFLLNDIGFDKVNVQPRHDYKNVDFNNYREQKNITLSKNAELSILEKIKKLFEIKKEDNRINITGECYENWVKFYKDPFTIKGSCRSTKAIFIDSYGYIRGCVSGKTLSNIDNSGLHSYFTSKPYKLFSNFAQKCKICINGCS